MRGVCLEGYGDAMGTLQFPPPPLPSAPQTLQAHFYVDQRCQTK